MYSKQEASQLRKDFWTWFGQYMRPIRNADGETVNWLNYKTGKKHIYFRMDANNKQASIEQFKQLENILHETVGEKWNWQLHVTDEDGQLVSKIGTVLNGVNIFKKEDWPTIISFLKPRIIALDQFWSMVKDGFE